MKSTAQIDHKPKPGSCPEELVYLELMRTMEALSHRFAQVLKTEDLSSTQYKVLRILRGASEGLPCGEIGNRMLTRDSDITRLLDRLERRAMITRPEVTDDDGTHVRVISGEFWGKRGPVEGVAADPHYVDVSVAPGRKKRLKVDITRNAFAYVFAGAGTFRDASAPQAVLTEQATDPHAEAVYDIGNHSLVLFDRGDEITVQAGPLGIRFLLVSGKPIEEPVAWHGPIVMNTQMELRQAMYELQNGTFVR
jgi:hypothetical protein